MDIKDILNDPNNKLAIFIFQFAVFVVTIFSLFYIIHESIVLGRFLKKKIKEKDDVRYFKRILSTILLTACSAFLLVGISLFLFIVLN